MRNDLLNDIRNDARFGRNLARIFTFIALLMVLDFVVSAVMEKGINRFYGLDSDAEVLMVGHSHLMLAVDKQLLEKQLRVKVAKYTREGVNVADRYIMLQQYFKGRSDRCRLIVYGIDPWLFTGEGLSANSYTLFYPFMDTPEVDAYVRQHAKNDFDYFSHKWFRSSRFNVMLVNAALRGYLGNWSNLKIGQLDTLNLRQEIASGKYRHISFDKENVAVFRKTLQFLGRDSRTVILLNTPVSGLLTQAVRKDYNKAFSMIREMATPYRNIHVVDLSPEFEDKASLFFDPIHMNPEGQRKVTYTFSAVAESLLVR
jgi:hypothetical protein